VLEINKISLKKNSSEVAKLSCRLLEFMAKGIGAEPASLLGMSEGQPQGMRMN